MKIKEHMEDKVTHHHTSTPHTHVWTISAQICLPNRPQKKFCSTAPWSTHKSHTASVTRAPTWVFSKIRAVRADLGHCKMQCPRLSPSLLMPCPPARGASQQPGRQHSAQAHAKLRHKWYLTCTRRAHAGSAPACLPAGPARGSAPRRNALTRRKEWGCLSTFGKRCCWGQS